MNNQEVFVKNPEAKLFQGLGSLVVQENYSSTDAHAFSTRAQALLSFVHGRFHPKG